MTDFRTKAEEVADKISKLVILALTSERTFADYIQPALRSAYARGVEDSAKVADDYADALAAENAALRNALEKIAERFNWGAHPASIEWRTHQEAVNALTPKHAARWIEEIEEDEK